MMKLITYLIGIYGVDNSRLGYLFKENSICDASGSSTKYHDAGYDAVATGLCFLAMIHRLATLIKPDGSKMNHQKYPIISHTDCLTIAKPFINKINMMRLLDIPYMNVGGEDIIPSREHVFYMTFPAEWKTGNLINLFMPSFGPIQVTWIDDSSAFVNLR